MIPESSENPQKTLKRSLGFNALLATGVCSMVGASIHVVPFMIQKNVPGIGNQVIISFLLAAIPCLLAALSYASLSTAMPEAGGSFRYVSKGLSPFAGFIASFSQWFGLSIVIGVVAFIIPDFAADFFINAGAPDVAEVLVNSSWRPWISLAILWTFAGLNLSGGSTYSNVLIPMMWLMIGSGAIVIVAGIFLDANDFLAAYQLKEGRLPPEAEAIPYNPLQIIFGATVLFSSYIGFDTIAQAGGEAKEPHKNLPRAMVLAVVCVGLFYILFTAAVYKMVPWRFMAYEVQHKNITAPGLLAYLLPPSLTLAVLAGATIALLNDLPGMILSVSRLLFAWASDGIFPRFLSTIHSKTLVPSNSIVASTMVASIGVLGSHFAGNFFLGIDIMVVAMMFNFLIITITLFRLEHKPDLLIRITFLKNSLIRKVVTTAGMVSLMIFLSIQIGKDLTGSQREWYFRGTLVWLLVMLVGSIIYWLRKRNSSQP